MSNDKHQDAGQKTLHFSVEVSGCPSTCMHCWATGHPYAPMRLEDIEHVLKEGAHFCDTHGLAFSPYPMHEVLTHESALTILQLFKAYAPDSFEPIPTTGLALADREDWEDVLAGILALGTKTLWFTFHGLEEVHNRTVNRADAFSQVVKTIRRAKRAGLRCGANFYVSSGNVDQLSRSLEMSEELDLDEIGFEVAHYYPTPRLRSYEAIRPEFEQLAAVAEMLHKHSVFHKDKWKALERCTEAYYMEKALSPEHGEAITWDFLAPDHVMLVCRGNLDLHSGQAGIYGPLHGNMKSDSPAAILEKAVKAGPYSTEQLFFMEQNPLKTEDLACKVGNQHGQKIHFNGQSMRLRWLDQSLNADLTAGMKE